MLFRSNQQKVQLAQTLVCNPNIIILDEPFSGLDPVNSMVLKDVILELIKENKLVIFSSHQMNYVEEFCEDICIINHGDVVLSGNLKKIKKEFGENRLILSASNYSLLELVDICNDRYKEFVEIYSIKKDFIVLDAKKENISKEFLSKLIESDINIEKFGVYEPSLNDLFVLKAGDDNEKL